MLPSSLFLAEQDPDEYIPLLPNRYSVDNESDNDSATVSNIYSNDDDDDDNDDENACITSKDKNNWLFSLINWDQIFENAASHLDINFTDYDYDRYGSNNKQNKNNISNKNTSSSIDTFNYFLSSLTNNRINMNTINRNPNNHKTVSNMNVISIYEIIYDRVAKSRLFSLKTIFDDIYPDINITVNRILAEIIKFELAPDTIRHMLYKSIINEYHKQCHPSLYKTIIVICNWFIYIIFFGIHIMWLQFVWMDFLKHFNWNDTAGTAIDGDTDHDDKQDIDQQEEQQYGDGHEHELNAHILSQSLSFQNASPFTIIDTISKWTYFQWTSAVLFIFLIIYMIFLYCIARRVDAFGDFLKKLQLTQLLKLGKGANDVNDTDNNNNNNNIDYGTGNDTQIMLQFSRESDNDNNNDRMNNNNNDDDDMSNVWGLESDDDDDDSSIFSESDLNEDGVWNYMSSPSPQQDEMRSDGKIDILSIKLLDDICNIYYGREHLILYTVISLVKMLIILLYLSCLVMFFIIPSANYWYLWSILIDIFTFYVILKACKQIFCRHNNDNNNNNNNISITTQRYINDNGDIGILDIDGIFKHEWIVAMVNILSVTGLLIICTLIISLYMNNYNKFIAERINYLQILAAIEIIWFASQFLLWKLNFYGTIFYLLLLIPSILFGSAAFYALYEYYILSLVHTFLAVIFSCGEFHLVGPHDDDTTLDPSDWSVLGVLALLAKLFKFRMPQQI